MDVLQAIKIRRSVRSYSPRPIPEEVMDRMRQALRSAPSACNYQPWRFIFVSDPELRREVARASFDQTWMAEAPVIVAGCGLPDQAYKTMRGRDSSVDIDVAIALDHLTLAAAADGLGTCWIGAFDEVDIRRLLEVPREAKIVALITLGYPAEPRLMAPLAESDRKTDADIFSIDRYRG